MMRRLLGLLVPVLLCAAAVLAGCSSSGGGTQYDISPLVALNPDKCAQYGGKLDGSGLSASCYVNQSECEQAAADYRQEMVNVPDAIIFTCGGKIGAPAGQQQQPAPQQTTPIDEASLSSALANSDEMAKDCPTPDQIAKTLPDGADSSTIRNIQCNHNAAAIAQFDVNGTPTWGAFTLLYSGGTSYWQYATDEEACDINFGFPASLATPVCGGPPSGQVNQ